MKISAVTFHSAWTR